MPTWYSVWCEQGDVLKRLRHDLNYLTSAGLLMTATVTAITGIVAHLWDLNDFWYHTYAGYAMAVFALAHVWLNVRRMGSYARFRFGRSVAAPHRATRKPTSPAPTVPGTAIAPGAERQGLCYAPPGVPSSHDAAFSDWRWV